MITMIVEEYPLVPAAKMRALKGCILFLTAALLLGGCGKSANTNADALVAAGDAVDNPPNILLIVADDLGYLDVSANAGGRYATPNIAKLASEGVYFTAGYAASSSSGPSRAALYTGRHPSRFGYEYDNSPPTRDEAEKLGLPLDEETLATVVKQRKYQTGLIGKWGLGYTSDYYPTNRGFDEFYGFLSGQTPQLSASSPDLAFVPTTTFPVAPLRNRYTQIVRGPEQKLVANGDKYLTTDFADQAVDFIDRNSQGRFFLTLALSSPAQPLQALKSDLKGAAPTAANVHAAMVQRMDSEIGRVLRALDSRGLAQNTLVIFTSDSGCDIESGACSCDGLRGGAVTLYDGGVRVPLFMRWPAVLKAGQRYERPVSLMDIFPTVLAVTGAERPAGKRMDGVDLLPYISGKKEGWPHETLLWMRRPLMAARYKDFKLLRDSDSGVLELYDLAADPVERKNIAASRADLVSTVQANMDIARTFVNDPLWLPQERKTLDFCGTSARVYR
jgi:arylsulfatase A-like enzyme